jgi:ABC-type lipoprotein release transport system permease subunit
LKLLLKLAWRNIWRNKRRLLLTLLAIAFATFATLAMRGMQIGTYAVNINNSVQMFSGYMQVQREGYQKNPSLRLNYVLDKPLTDKFNSVSQIKAYTPRVYGDGLISFKDNSFGTAIFGIDPQKEKNVTNILNRVKEGKFFSSDTTNEIVLGYKLLENLKAKVGDEVVILSQGYDGSLANMKFKISGTVKMGSSEIDGMAVFMGLSKSQDFLALSNRIHAIVINTEGLDEIVPVKEELTKKLNSKELSVLSWDEVMPDFKQSIEFDNISGIMYLLILIIIVAFGILNTVLMSVVERFNEFGISLSIGMPQIKLVYLVFIETFFITAMGLLLGNIIGWGINYYFMGNPIQVGRDLGNLYEEFGFLPIIVSSLDPMIFINTTLTILAVSAAVCFYPAYKVYKLEPLKGIRYT